MKYYTNNELFLPTRLKRKCVWGGGLEGMYNKWNQSPLTQGKTDAWVLLIVSASIISKEQKLSEYLTILYVAGITIL